MKTLILSSSLSLDSKSFVLCENVFQALSEKGVETEIIDARVLDIQPTHKARTEDTEVLIKKISEADNIIIGFGVHCYSISDNLKIILDTCFEEATGKFFGIICAAGGEKSYLATTHLSQICMNERRMIQLPRTLFASAKAFSDKNEVIDEDVQKRIQKFSDEFYDIGSKLV